MAAIHYVLEYARLWFVFGYEILHFERRNISKPNYIIYKFSYLTYLHFRTFNYWWSYAFNNLDCYNMIPLASYKILFI